MDMTSLLVDATFYKGKIFNSAGAIIDSPKLRRKLEDGFVRNCRLYTDISLYVAMGDGVGTIFGKLQESGVIKSSIVTMPHPSGANAGRIAVFLGEKECTDRATSRARELFNIAYATVKNHLLLLRR